MSKLREAAENYDGWTHEGNEEEAFLAGARWAIEEAAKVFEGAWSNPDYVGMPYHSALRKIGDDVRRLAELEKEPNT
jgi:hypothetical protein